MAEPGSFLRHLGAVVRRILVDFARTKRFAKRGGAAVQVSLAEAVVIPQERDADLVALDEALAALSEIDERKSRVVELRFFGGLSVEETAEVLKISPETVMRDWKVAKVWLLHELSSRAATSGSGKEKRDEA